MILNIAMDGPAGAGKSTIATAVAKRLGILHLDTGAMYRAVALSALRTGIDIMDEEAVTAHTKEIDVTVTPAEKGQHTFLSGEDVSALIRTPEVSAGASRVATYQGVRREMVACQQKIAASTPMLVDGRDICLRVLPNAPVKIFLTASDEERARRRWAEMVKDGSTVSYEDVLRDLRARDEQDMNREVDPLRPTPDAVIIDTTDMSFDQVVDYIIRVVEEKIHE